MKTVYFSKFWDGLVLRSKNGLHADFTGLQILYLSKRKKHLRSRPSCCTGAKLFCKACGVLNAQIRFAAPVLKMPKQVVFAM